MKKYSVPALEKAIEILDLIAASEKEYSITEIHKALDISKSTVFTTLNVLEAHDFVKKDDKGGYGIGLKLYQLGMSYISKIDIIKIARPHLEELMRDTGFSVHLGILEDGEVSYVDKVEADTFIKFSTFIGKRSSIHINSLGKAIAAFLGQEELDQIIAEKGLERHTSHTITDPHQFRQSLKEIHKKGYAIEDEEEENGVRCIGAPVFDRLGEHVSAAISIVGHTSEFPSESFPEVGEKVKLTAETISKELGYIERNMQ